MPTKISTFDPAHVRAWMRAEVQIDPRRYVDSAWESNPTALAEAAAAAFDQADEGGPLDDETHWIWELAMGEAELAEVLVRRRAS